MYSLVIGIVILLIILVIFTGSCPCTWPAKVCDVVTKCGCPICGGLKKVDETFKTNSCVGTFDCIGENFNTKGDVAAGTMFSGYQYRTALPK